MPEKDYSERLRESMQKLREIIKKITVENKNRSIEDVPVQEFKQDEQKEQIKEQLNNTERPKAIGIFSFSYKNPTKIVKDGGDLT